MKSSVDLVQFASFHEAGEKRALTQSKILIKTIEVFQNKNGYLQLQAR